MTCLRLVDASKIYSGGWMFVEGINLQMKISKNVLQTNAWYRQYMAWINNVVGWIVPLIIVAIASSVGFSNGSYMDKNENYEHFKQSDEPIEMYKICWLSSKSNVRRGAFIIPLALMLTANFVFVVRTAVFVVSMKLKESNIMPKPAKIGCPAENKVKDLQVAFKTIILLAPATGLLWIFMLLTGALFLLYVQ